MPVERTVWSLLASVRLVNARDTDRCAQKGLAIDEHKKKRTKKATLVPALRYLDENHFLG